MASPAVSIGTGTTIAFATSSFTGQVVSITHSGMTRPVLSTAHMGTTAVQSGELNNMTKAVGEIVDGGQFTVEMHLNPDTVVPMGGAVEVVTITVNGGATWVFNGAIMDASAAIPLDDIMTRTVVVEVCGPIAVTAAA